MTGTLWRRHLTDYPDTRARAAYLAIVILAAAIVFYEFYVAASVSPAIIAGYHMTFRFYVYTIAAASASGALGSLAAGAADRWGRANLIGYGMMANGALTLVGIPAAGGQWEFAVVFVIIGYIGGVILVATPALVRDFAQRLGRASAMGLWALGPVAGSLAVAVMSSLTLGRLHPWRDQFTLCGIAGLAAGLLAVVFLRDLSPGLRETIREAMRERAAAEARARGIGNPGPADRPWRRMLRPGVAVPAFGCAAFLLIYYTAVAFFTMYFTTVRGFPLATADSLGGWFWACGAVAVLLAGIASDMTAVRKPFMAAGAVGAIAATIVLADLGPGTSYGTFAVVVSVLGVFLAVAFAPWMASFTETVERHAPAAPGTGLAVWGWTVWAAAAVALLVLPSVVTSMAQLAGPGHSAGGAGAAGAASAGAAVAEAARQWRYWLWACAAGQAVFLPCVFLLAGPWSPRKARRDAEEHARRLDRETAALRRR